MPNQINNNMYYHYCFYYCYYYKKPCCNNKTRGIPFLAFVLCALFYVCIFYVFNVSPRDVMHDVRFLFFFSNTLIVVIATDYGTFVSEEKDEEESRAKAASEGPVPCDDVMVRVPVESYAETDNGEKELEENVAENDPGVLGRSEEVKLLTYDDVGSCDVKGRSDGDEDGEGSTAEEEEERVVAKDEENDEFSWTSDETDSDEDGEGNDEFSRMSDEELNKRVEEFIRRLKTQIQLQAARDAE